MTDKELKCGCGTPLRIIVHKNIFERGEQLYDGYSIEQCHCVNIFAYESEAITAFKKATRVDKIEKIKEYCESKILPHVRETLVAPSKILEIIKE